MSGGLSTISVLSTSLRPLTEAGGLLAFIYGQHVSSTQIPILLMVGKQK